MAQFLCMFGWHLWFWSVLDQRGVAEKMRTLFLPGQIPLPRLHWEEDFSPEVDSKT